MNSKAVLKLLVDDGWYVVAVRGSHYQLKHPVKRGRVTLPHPKKDLPKGTVSSIFRQADL